MGRAPRRTRGLRAFTLLEVLVVLGILALLVGFSWPYLEGRITASSLPESADRIRDMLFMVRAEAAMEHRRHRIRFAPEQQHPIIEYEPDPIREPGLWEPIDSPWTKEAILVSDVQVHEIRLGRPRYLRPISDDEDPTEEEQQEFEDEGLETDEFQFLDTEASVMDDEEEAIDEDRPLIIFEADGSTEWATFILATKPLEEVLEEEDRQLWVVLDGRTGLAKVREKVTEAQLSDPEFYIQREKLELPDVMNTDELALQIGNNTSGGNGLGGGNASGNGSGNGGSGGNESGNPDGNGAGAGNGRNGPDMLNDEQQGGQAGVQGLNDGNDDSGEFKETDLTEEEQLNILRTLEGNRDG